MGETVHHEPPCPLFQSPSSPNLIRALCSHLWSKFSLLIRVISTDDFYQANFVRINTFLTFRWILNVWFLRSVIQNPKPRASLKLMSSELLLSKREIGGDISRLKMIHTQAASPVQFERGVMFHSIDCCVLYIKTSVMTPGGVCPLGWLLGLGVITISSSSFPPRSVFSGNLWELFTSILFTRDKMLICWHFTGWGREGGEGRKTYVIYSFIIPRRMGSHLFTWLTCLGLITTHS